VHGSTAAAIGLVVAIATTGCAPAPIALDRVRRIEVASSRDGQRAGVILQGKVLERALASAKCHPGGVLWKGGIPARLVLDDGTVVEADGLSFYGGFLRVHRGQWCELDQSAWDALFPPPP
jgi:hypothetical protein